MTITRKKLALRKQSLRRLDDSALAAAHGGTLVLIPISTNTINWYWHGIDTTSR
jgi:hypothetical protein